MRNKSRAEINKGEKMAGKASRREGQNSCVLLAATTPRTTLTDGGQGRGNMWDEVEERDEPATPVTWLSRAQ